MAGSDRPASSAARAIVLRLDDLALPPRYLTVPSHLPVSDLLRSLPIPSSSYGCRLPGSFLMFALPPSDSVHLCLRALRGGGGVESCDCYLSMYLAKKPDKADPNEARLSRSTGSSSRRPPSPRHASPSGWMLMASHHSTISSTVVLLCWFTGFAFVAAALSASSAPTFLLAAAAEAPSPAALFLLFFSAGEQSFFQDAILPVGEGEEERSAPQSPAPKDDKNILAGETKKLRCRRGP